MTEPPTPSPVPDEHLEEWKSSALLARSCRLVMQRTVDPVPGSALATADLHYPHEKVSAWTREYLLAAGDSLGFWADHFSPYEFAPDAAHEVPYRSYLLLGRAGLEAAAHALWPLSSPTSEDCASRHVRLLHRDFRYHRQALRAGVRDESYIQSRIDNLERRARDSPLPLRPADNPPGYEGLIRHAARYVQRDPDEWAYIWNAASGAAHGQNWFGIEGYELHSRDEYEPGYFRIQRLPDPEFITATMDAASLCVLAGTHRWLSLGGHPDELYRQALQDISDRMPKGR